MYNSYTINSLNNQRKKVLNIPSSVNSTMAKQIDFIPGKTTTFGLPFSVSDNRNQVLYQKKQKFGRMYKMSLKW